MIIIVNMNNSLSLSFLTKFSLSECYQKKHQYNNNNDAYISNNKENDHNKISDSNEKVDYCCYDFSLYL